MLAHDIDELDLRAGIGGSGNGLYEESANIFR
jgi:hypothetical protein